MLLYIFSFFRTIILYEERGEVLMNYKENIVDYHDLGQRIRQKREALGLSQEQLAADANISQPTLFRLEKAKSKVELATLISVANVLQVSLDELLCASLNYQNNNIYQYEHHELVKDCTSQELRLVNDVVGHLLNSLHHHYPQNN